jgi:hypothetical protein
MPEREKSRTSHKYIALPILGQAFVRRELRDYFPQL